MGEGGRAEASGGGANLGQEVGGRARTLLTPGQGGARRGSLGGRGRRLDPCAALDPALPGPSPAPNLGGDARGTAASLVRRGSGRLFLSLGRGARDARGPGAGWEL